MTTQPCLFILKGLKKHEKEFINLLSTIENNQSKFSELWEKLGDIFPSTFTNSSFQIVTVNQFTTTNSSKSVSYQICKKTVRSITELKLLFVEETEKLVEQRDNLLDEFKNLMQNGITSELVETSADCHLREKLFASLSKNKPVLPKCGLCRCDKGLRTYSNQLFANSDTINKLVATSKQTEDGESREEEPEINTHRSYSDLEKLFRFVHSLVRRDETLKEDGAVAKHLVDSYELLKNEFKILTQLWLYASDEISALDELAMTKLRMVLRDEYDDDIQRYDFGNVIARGGVDYTHRMHEEKREQSFTDVKKKFGQLMYLENLVKSNALQVNTENEELCPCCQSKLGYKWFVLKCGHSFCEECTLNGMQRIHSTIKCPYCRETCTDKDQYLVTTISAELDHRHENPTLLMQVSGQVNLDQSGYESYNKNELANVKIKVSKLNFFKYFIPHFRTLNIKKGNTSSAKVLGIVKCLIEIVKAGPEDKCIVFSEHITMLELITELLRENGIGYKLIKAAPSLQANIQEYKRDPSMNVLLMPYSFGANGLNVIEATHVLLVEPTLNRSQEAQAIGRVHRIGQTKPTTVYRFIIRNTIEELVFNLFKNSTSYSKRKSVEGTSADEYSSTKFASANQNQLVTDNQAKKVLTIKDIKDLFQKL